MGAGCKNVGKFPSEMELVKAILGSGLVKDDDQSREYVKSVVKTVLSAVKKGQSIKAVDDTLTTQEAADLLNVSVTFFKEKILGKGVLPYFEVGNRKKVRRFDIEQYIQQRMKRMEDHIPNTETKQALEMADSGDGVKDYKSTQELFDDLGL